LTPGEDCDKLMVWKSRNKLKLQGANGMKVHNKIRSDADGAEQKRSGMAAEALSGFYDDKKYFDKYIKDGIEKHRKGNFCITVKGGADKLTVRQVSHAFKFGCNAFMLDSFTPEEQYKEALYKDLFVGLFNQAVVPFYWLDLEPNEGELRFGKDSPKIYRRPAPDVVLEFCRQHKIAPKGHCLLWNCTLPPWLAKYSADERKRLVEKRFREIAEAYGDKIDEWDVVNESATNYTNGKKVLFADWDDFAVDLGAKYFKNNTKILNETNRALWFDYAWSGKYYPFGTQVDKLLSRGASIDMLGLQYHMFLLKDEFMSTAKGVFLDKDVMMGVLEHVNSYGKPMVISEITVPSWFGKNEDDLLTQAEIVEFLYKLWFSVENMHGIVWWNLADGYAAYAARNADEGENSYGAGLVNYDMSKKPAYDALDRLINRDWKTSLSADNVANLEFRGFYGEYEAEILKDGKRRTVEFAIKKGGANILNIDERS
jgi:GH35 family endo-1,4-beta-xylanase